MDLTVEISAIVALFKMAPDILTRIQAGEDGIQIIADELPAVVPLLEALISTFVPGAGLAIEVLIFAISMQRPLTQQEINDYMDDASKPSFGPG